MRTRRGFGLGLAAVCFCATNAAAQEPEPKRVGPTAPDGFRVDLVAEAPEILWPSAVLCLDDGSLLVGEDRMDMPGPTDQPLDRVIQLHWNADGTYTKTAFAEKLYAVMGLEEKDGDVYVMNMPFLTRLRDKDGDGVAEEREEILTNLGPPAPGWWPDGFNDHIVSGIRFGLDGRLYVAVGDKGIPGATGRDGSSIQLRGGGVVRLLPDGTELEVVARGLRNVLDVAIDANGEMFTYDNTDDGLGWWTRVTHIVPGGAYGYPWDYTQRPERTLPCMKDYGGGSPCGGLVYREAAWPAPYRGSWFHCEWGKGVLRRFELERDGATFRVAKDEDFVTAGDVKSFRPFDVCESPDGRFLYVSDWANDGWTNPTECGRIWRIRRADDDARVPNRARELPATTAALVSDLDDHSYRQRTRAQRELARRPAAETVDALLAAATGPGSETSRLHAMWALDALARGGQLSEAGDAGRDGWRRDLAGVLLARWLAFDGDAPRAVLRRLVPLLRHADPFVRRQAAGSMARLLEHGRDGPPRSTQRSAERAAMAEREGALLLALELAEDRWERFAIVQALRANGSVPDVLVGSAVIQGDLIEVLRENFTAPCVAMLARTVRAAADEGLRLRALVALADSVRNTEPWDGKWWSIQPAAKPPPAKAVDWEGTPAALAGLRAALEDRAPAVRLAALRALQDAHDEAGLAAVHARWARETEPSVRIAILDLLGALRDSEAGPVIASVLEANSASDEERTHAVEAAARIGAPELLVMLDRIAGDESALDAQVLPCLAALGRQGDVRSLATLERRLGRGSSAVRAAAITAYVAARGAPAASTLEPLLGDEDAAVRRAACRAFGWLALVQHVPSVLALVADPETRSDAIAALARTPDERALAAYLEGLSLPDNGLRLACQGALSAIRVAARPAIESLHAQWPLASDVLEQVRAIYSEPQAIRGWKLIGPFARQDAAPRIDPADVDFTRALEGLAGREVAWIDHIAQANGFVDLEKQIDDVTESEVFAYTTVTSPRARTAQFRLGSDDQCSVWINGEMHHDFQGVRAFTADADRFEAPLVSGSNTILLRVGNGGGQWSFALRMSEEMGGTLFESEVPAVGAAHRAFALEHPGDPVRGYEIFRQTNGPMCIRCHVVAGTGTPVGPDLSDVALKYPRDELITSILEPSKRVADGYRTVALELDDGLVAYGMLKSETKDAIELWDATGTITRVEAKEVVSRRTIPMSVMPDGLVSLLSPSEFADLVAWLDTLKAAAAK